MKKHIITKLTFVFFAAPAIVFAQSVSQINTRIDSLESVKKDLESKLNTINNEIDGLKKMLETVSTTMIHQMDKVFGKTMSKAVLYSEASPFSQKMIEIPKNSVLELLDYEDMYYKVIYKWQTGFVLELDVVENDTLKLFKNKKSRERATEAEIQRQKQTAEARASKTKRAQKEEIRKKAEAEKEKLRQQKLIETFGETIAGKILEHKIWLGMTREMAKESIGLPNDINRTVNAAVVREQWVYDSKKLYLYFENGILVSWQD